VILASFPEIEETLWLHPDSVTDLTKLYVSNTFPDLQKLVERAELFEEGRRLIEHPENIFVKMHGLTRVSTKFPNVVNHGDPWANNMLFRYDESGKTILNIFRDMNSIDFKNG
jgi:hypothetical protein